MQNFILNLNLGRAIKENGLQINKSFLERLPLYQVIDEKGILFSIDLYTMDLLHSKSGRSALSTHDR